MQGTPPAPSRAALSPISALEGAIKAGELYKKAFAAEKVHLNPPDDKGRTMHVHILSTAIR